MPLPSTPHLGRELSGALRFRRTWAGRLVLQCEERVDREDSALASRKPRWWDMRREDLWRVRAIREHLGIEPLI